MTSNEAPYGFKRDENGELVRDEAEQEVLAAVRAAREAGLPMDIIIEQLRARGFIH